MQLCNFIKNIRHFNAGCGRRCCLLAWLLLAGFRISSQAQTSLNVTNYGAVGDTVRFSVNTVSNSPMVTVNGTNIFSSADIGKVIEVFRAGPLVYYQSNLVVTQQDIIDTIKNVSNGTNISFSIPCGYTTTNTYCIVGTNNAPAFQAAINAASNLVAIGSATNVTINIPAGNYMLVSSNVLNPHYVMTIISDTHPALRISSGGITFSGVSATNTVLMGCGAGMEHLVNSSLSWISPSYAPYVPMRDTLVICSGPIANSQYPLVFQNLTFDGGLTNGFQSYNYWQPIQGNGDGWDTTHHAVADSGGVYNVGGKFVQWQMHQLKVFTNCIFQHWRGEMLICWTGNITNAFNEIDNCVFQDGNATADNMYYGQHVKNCVFNKLSKVEEFYQQNSSLSNTFEYNLCTNINGNNYYFTVVGATKNETEPKMSINNNTWYGTSGNFIQFSSAANVSVVSNSFNGLGGVVVFTSAGVQPSDGSAIAVMTNFMIAGNSFGGGFLSMDGYPVADMMISNNTGIHVYGGSGYKENIIMANNTGPAYDGQYEGVSSQISSGHYILDQTNNVWGVPNTPGDGGNYAVTNYISYANGGFHKLTASGSMFYLDDSHPELIPNGALLNVSAITWTRANVNNLYLSAVSPGLPVTLTNGTSMTFYWNGAAWANNSPIAPSLTPPTNLRFN